MTLWFRNIGCFMFTIGILVLGLALAALALVVAAAWLIHP